MTSVGVQAQISDSEGFLGLIQSFHAQLTELVQMSTSLVSVNASRGEGVRQCEGLMRDIEGKMEGLAGSTAYMENMLYDNNHALEDHDSQLEQLTNTLERLDGQIGELERQTNSNVSTDVDSEQRLAGFAVEELSRKIDTLANLHSRLDQAKHGKHDEWNQFKSDLNQHEEDIRPFLQNKEHLEELALARYVGMQSMKDVKDSERDMAQRMCDHHRNKALHRQLQQQFMQSQIKQQDLEDEIGGLVRQKQELWKRCLDLENCLDEIKGTSEGVHTLHPSSAYADLPFVSEGRPKGEESDSDNDTDEEAEAFQDQTCHGRLLHRCPKNTNIVVGPYQEDESTDTGTGIQTTAEDTTENKLDSTTMHDITAEAPTTSQEQQPEIEATPDQDHQDAEAVRNQSRTGQRSRTGARHTPGGEEHHNSSMVTKLRKRMGLTGRHSSSTRVKGTKLPTTGSTRAIHKDAVTRRKR